MRVELMKCLIDNLTLVETLDRVEDLVRQGGPCQHGVINVDKIVKANRDPSLLEILNRCELINADGMPVVWASRLLGRPLKERVAGIDLFLALVARGAERGWRIFFLGARQDVLDRTIEVLGRQHPGLVVAGRHHGFWTAQEEAAVVAQIRQARPDLLFVAISSPRKERFLGEYARDLGVPFAMGVGGSFDVVAGLTRRAPRWMQRTGLEWFYRFMQEPRRMFRRYFIDDPYFLILLWRAWRRRPS